MRDHYRILQVTRDADPEVIERAYRTLARKHHPDRASAANVDDANARMRALNEAYSVLRDPARRVAYDATLAPEGESAWDVFLDRGLVGMFLDRLKRG